jgi:hypothetical protein
MASLNRLVATSPHRGLIAMMRVRVEVNIDAVEIMKMIAILLILFSS